MKNDSKKSELKKKLKLDKKNLIFPGVVIASVIFLTLIVTGAVMAYQKDHEDERAQRFAERFNLDQSKVQEFMNEEQETRRAEMEQEIKSRQEEMLSKAVEEGKITNNQKSALIQKWEEYSSKQQALRDDYQEWLEEQGIDLKELGLMGMGIERGSYGLRMGK
jgi:hypothetical protein